MPWGSTKLVLGFVFSHFFKDHPISTNHQSYKREVDFLWHHQSFDILDILLGALDLRHVFRSNKVLVFGAMEDIRNDKYLATS